MEFVDAASFFNTELLYDGYTGEELFPCQMSVINTNLSDGSTIRRRVMNHAPEFDMPTRRVVKLFDVRYLVGGLVEDGFMGEMVRKSYSVKTCDAAMSILTPAQAANQAAGTLAYCQRLHYKDTANPLTDSEYDPFWNVFFAPVEPIQVGTWLRDQDGTLYRVRGHYLPTEGLRVAQSDQMDPVCLQTLVFDTGTYNPVTETRTAGTTSVPGLMVELPKFYKFRYRTEEDIQPGDWSVFIPTTFTPKTGDVFTMDGMKWHVLTFQSELDSWALHVRLV